MSEAIDPLLSTVVAGRYRIVRRLGCGGMGAVYAAEQAPLGREVALKVLRPEFARDPVAVERFKREAQLIAALHHPHIVNIHDFGADDDGTLFIAMELLPGEDLSSRLRRTGPLSWDAALVIVEQIARALAGAHAKGVVHRDLKPANVLLLDVDGARAFVKVVDFGVAKLMRADRNEDGAPRITGDGFVPGTPGYIAPENIAGGDGDDPRSDLYSLGVTWFELLTGSTPFVGDSAMQILLQQLHGEPPRPSDLARLSLPAAGEALLVRLLAREPSMRPASATTLLAELGGLGAEGLPLADAPGTGSTKRRPDQSIFVALGAVVAFASGGASVVFDDAPWGNAPAPIIAPPARPEPSAIAEPTTPVHPALTPTPMATPTAAKKLPKTSLPAPEPPSRTPLTTPAPTPTADELWRSEAMAVLSGCSEGCAKVIAARLPDLDAATLPPRVRAGVNECVAKCRH